MGSLRRSHWVVAVIYLITLGGVANFLAPATSIDPWGLINIQKLLWMLWALSLLQFIGAILNHWLGVRAGMLLMGFMAGLVSSTVLTISLAKESKNKGHVPETVAVGSLLAGKMGVLLEAVVLLFAADGGIVREVYWILLSPLLLCGALIILLSKKQKVRMEAGLPSRPINYLSVLQLSVFIAGILAFSRFAYSYFGDSGILLTSFAVSLFEVHGSLIASAQMMDRQAILEPVFRLSVALALSAAATSKILLMFFLGSRKFALKGSIAMILFILSIWVGYIVQPMS